MGLIVALLAGRAHADTSAPSMEELAQVLPGADRVGVFQGDVPAAPAYRADEVVGYVFSTYDTIGSVGYSGKPLDVLAGVDTAGRITGAYLRSHSEPILIIGIGHDELERYVSAFRGIDLTARFRTKADDESGSGLPDAISGATVSSAVIADSVVRAGRNVARSRGILGDQGAARLDRETFEPMTWQALMDQGAIARLDLDHGAVAERFAGTGVTPFDVAPEAPFIELRAALVTPPAIGQNLLGKGAYNRLLATMASEDQAILIAANGRYSFKGTSWIRDGVFDRIQIVQGSRSIQLTRDMHGTVRSLGADDAPEFRELATFVLPASTGFDPLKPWRVDLMVTRETESGTELSALFGLEYRLPDAYIVRPAGAGEVGDAPDEASAPLWQSVWIDQAPEIALLVTMLAVLTTVLVFQDWIVRRKRLYERLRLGFLLVTLGWLGWYAGAQLSVVNVLTFIHALMTDFRWDYFLLDPLMFVLWSYVAVALLFWGRGVFCGWLCPFGALQELLNKAARALRVPQIKVPFGLHERLWPIKYIIFIGLFALSLNEVNHALVVSEVEPFKTAISLKFVRAWPFVLYAGLLLVAGLFIERFFCRYLCPLGGALAIPARLRMFDWLKRRFQCGAECAICARECTVQAIHPNGQINPNECIHCLQCQAIYADDHLCPPLVALRKRREKRLALAGTGTPASAGDE